MWSVQKWQTHEFFFFNPPPPVLTHVVISLSYFPRRQCPDSMLFTRAYVNAMCRSTVHMLILRRRAALRHKATSPLFPVYDVWGFLFSVSLRWLILWFRWDVPDRLCAEMKHWSLLIFCSNLMRLESDLFIFFLLHQVFILFFFFLPFFCHRFEEIVKKFKVEYHAGGATQNSVKIAQVCLSSFSKSVHHSNPDMSVKASLCGRTAPQFLE